MSTFADFYVNARVPARYRDARSGLFGVDGTGVSPFVWWWYDNYWRVTDRSEDGTIEFRPRMNVNAYHLAGAIQHLANPCAECGRE